MPQARARESTLIRCMTGIAGAALLLAASGAQAETTRFSADLRASNEVPPVQASATGTLTAIYDSVAKRLSWKGSYAGLSGAATAAHIHGPAPTGANARLVVWISDNIGQCSQGECRLNGDTKAQPLASPFEGSATLTDAQAADLAGGLYYANIHTNLYPRGEIRGQLVKAP